VTVAKHGNRSVSSRCGSADLFEALGVNVAAPPEIVERCLAEAGIAFFFAPTFHPSMRHAAPVRRDLGIRTAFNLLGPLTNPAGTTRQLLGIADATAAERMAEVVRRLGTERTFVIHGDGVDELPLDGSGVAYIVVGDAIERHVIDAAALGFKRTATARLAGGTADENARLSEAVLRGEPGARRDVVLLNAAAALLVAGVVGQMEEGIERAALTIDAGEAAALLDRLRDERRAADAAKAAAGSPA
jgi:anthranilate phosphoribosyltransferase